MSRSDRNGAARRSRFVPACAIWALLAAVGCLNPMPDDFPNDRDTSPDESTGAAGTRGNGEGNLPAPGQQGSAGGGGGASSAPVDEPSANAPDAGVPGDGGVFGDAGAPDAGDAGARVSADAGQVQP